MWRMRAQSTITSSTSRRIQTGAAGLGAVEFPSNLRSQRWVRRRNRWLAEGSGVQPDGYQPTTSNVHVAVQEDAGRFQRQCRPELYR